MYFFSHEHFIHNSDLFKQNDANSVMSSTSLTKDNFEDLLKLHHRLIVNSHLSCHDTKLVNSKELTNHFWIYLEN